MSVKHLTTAEFDAVVDSSPLTLVDFWATWCGPCRMVGPIIEKLGEKYEGQAVIAKASPPWYSSKTARSSTAA